MNNTIPFKKNIIFKTKIHDITDITLTHDYKVLEDMVEGEFYLSGTYKITEASVVNEEFYHNIPFSIALSDRIKKETIDLKIEDFKYSIQGDTLLINIDLNMSYDEENNTRSVEEIINEIDEKITNEEEETEIEDTSVNMVKSEISNNTIDTLLSNINNTNKYSTYKVHIVRNDDSLESIANKYEVSLDIIKEYNKTDNINIGDKIIIPFINE